MTPNEMIATMDGKGEGTPSGHDNDEDQDSSGRVKRTMHSAAANRRVGFNLPPNPTQPTLEAGLKEIARAQAEEADIALDLAIQGKERPSD